MFTSDKFLDLTFLAFFRDFYLWWPFLTSRQTFLKSSHQELHFEDNLSSFEKVWNLTFLGLFSRFWPLITSNDLETNFPSMRTWSSSFWGMICILLMEFKIWPFCSVFAIFDLWWPFLTLRLTFLKSSRQELHFEV